MATNTFTTDRLRETTRARFTAAEIGLSTGVTVRLVPLTRLEGDARKGVIDTLAEFADLPDDSDTTTIELATEALEKLVKLLCSDGDDLLADLHDDDPLVYSNMLGEVVQYWGRETRLGEAQNSVG